uniref:CSON003493 protein n=1 Tax=Culicoides sonorensis TaxID=179676 RepID=A0A336L5B8_CULSO
MSPKLLVLTIFSLGTLLSSQVIQGTPLEYYGTRIGPLSQLHHKVSGEVFAVDSRTLFIKNFNYDGEGPAAYFYVGNTRAPSNEGAWRLRDERGNAGVIKRYRNKDITLSLPEGKTLRDITWFSVWCDEFAVNFGDVKIPKNLDFPRPQKIAGLKGIHGVTSDPIVLVDAQTLLIPNFSYDGEAPDAKFWTGHGSKPSPQGIRIPDENGKIDPLRKYDKKTIVLTLPGDVTVFDVGHFGVWCEAFTVDFAHVKIPESANVPPSLKMLGISPQSKLNCEVLLDDIAFEMKMITCRLECHLILIKV